MSIQNCDERKVLQKLGEDSAYTFKGLYKTADLLRLEYKVLLFVTLSFSIIILGFDVYLYRLLTKILSVIALIVSVWLLINQKEYEKAENYMKLGDKYKNLFDKIRNAYYLNDFKDIQSFQQEISTLREKSHSYPIGSKARQLSKYLIEKEMDLRWIYDKCEKR